MADAGRMSSQIRKTITVFGLMGGLAACGGGGGSDGPVTVDPPNPPVTPIPGGPGADLLAARNALLATYTAPTVYTSLGAVPTNGGAVYEGYFRGDLANTSDTITDTLIGEMTMNVTFTSTSLSVSGTVDGFLDADDDALSGSLALGNGSLDRAGNPTNDATLLVTANGTLTDDRGRALVVGTQLEGDFLGSGHRAVGGEVLGRITVNGVDQDFDGGFIAAR